MCIYFFHLLRNNLKLSEKYFHRMNYQSIKTLSLMILLILQLLSINIPVWAEKQCDEIAFLDSLKRFDYGEVDDIQDLTIERMFAEVSNHPDSIIISKSAGGYGNWDFHLNNNQSYLRLISHNGYEYPPMPIDNRLFKYATILFFNKSVPLILKKVISDEFVFSDIIAGKLDVTVFNNGRKSIETFNRVAKNGAYMTISSSIFDKFHDIIRKCWIEYRLIFFSKKHRRMITPHRYQEPKKIIIRYWDMALKDKFYKFILTPQNTEVWLIHEDPNYIPTKFKNNKRIEIINDGEVFKMAEALFSKRDKPIIESKIYCGDFSLKNYNLLCVDVEGSESKPDEIFIGPVSEGYQIEFSQDFIRFFNRLNEILNND